MIESRESCYRVAVLSGSLEVSARLTNTDDLELLVRVLEANKVLFAKPEEFKPEIVATTNSPETNYASCQQKGKASVKADLPPKKTPAKADESDLRALMNAARSEPEILILT
ncbi:MAG: hypothetical protein WAM06_00800 [Methyloceanibacter sp.]